MIKENDGKIWRHYSIRQKNVYKTVNILIIYIYYPISSNTVFELNLNLVNK